MSLRMLKRNVSCFAFLIGGAKQAKTRRDTNLNLRANYNGRAADSG